MSNGKAYNMRLASRLTAVKVLRQQVLLRICENEQQSIAQEQPFLQVLVYNNCPEIIYLQLKYLQVLYAFAFLTTKSEIRVPPTTPFVGAEDHPLAAMESNTCHQRTSFQKHDSNKKSTWIPACAGMTTLFHPYTRSHASRGNAEASTQKPGWPGGCFASKGEGHNLQAEEINHITAGGCSATDGEGKNPEKEINPGKKINTCIKDGTLCMPPIDVFLSQIKSQIKPMHKGQSFMHATH